MSSSIPSIMRRFSRSNSARKSQTQDQNPQSPTSYNYHNNVTSGQTPGGNHLSSPTTPSAGSARDQALGGGYTVLPPTSNNNNNNNNNNHPGASIPNEGRPISSATDQSFDFANRPVSGGTTAVGGGTGPGSMSMGSQMQMPQLHSLGGGGGGGNLSRTDQVVLKYFWESKHLENTKRDLHYLKFPLFPQYPSHRDLLPYCEIYHLVKTSPGANIIGLGSADGVYIGFELATGSQLHIDLDDDWFTSNSTTRITHHRVLFRPYASVLSDPGSAQLFKQWPKPLTIEFLEQEYLAWQKDLMALCWEGREVRVLGAGGAAGGNAGAAGGGAAGTSSLGGGAGGGMTSGGSLGSASMRSARHAGSVGDDGYVSERSTGREL